MNVSSEPNDQGRKNITNTMFHIALAIYSYLVLYLGNVVNIRV